MKKLILTLVSATALLPAIGRETPDNFNKSVFRKVQYTNFANSDIAEKNIALTKEIFPGWTAFTDTHSGELLDAYGTAVYCNGNNIGSKAENTISLLTRLGINPAEWEKVKELQGIKADHVNYTRSISGHRVMFSKLGLRFSKDGMLTRVQLRAYGTPAFTAPSLSRSAVEGSNYETADIPGITILSKKVNEWVWFPVPTEGGYSLHPAWEVIVNANVSGAVPLKLRCYIDGKDGELLYRTNEVKETFDVTVKGNVYKTSILNPPTDEPLENLVVYGPSTQYITNNLGYVNDPFLSLPAATTFRLEGKWSVVVDDPTSQVPTFNQNIIATGGTYVIPASTRHVSAYYHVNKVHDFMKSYFTAAFTDMDFQLPTNVDLVTGTCNAFYNGTSINFYAAGGGCNSLAETPDVVYHEYGHGISDHYYDYMGMWTIQNGALNEACSDVWGMSITGIPINGNGAFTSIPGGAFFRRYDQAPHIYPRDLIEEVHGDGEIVAGAWWDVAVNLGNVADMTRLFTLTYDDTPDGPDGTEGQVYHDVLVSALLNDDNDNNLSNGTPHFSEIVKAFARHGIYLLGEVTLQHADIPHPAMGSDINISATLNVQDPTYLQSAVLHYRNRNNGKWNALTLTQSGNKYSAKIPAQKAGAIIDYYFQLYTLQGALNGTFPLMYDSTTANAYNVTIPYQFAVHVVAKDSNTFESSAGNWTIGNAPGDDATTGLWTVAKPISSYAGSSIADVYMSQMGEDHTTGTGKCLVTENATFSTSPVGDADVDNGTTTVITPSFDLSTYIDPVIEYYRWYSDSKGGNPHNDAWIVKVGSVSGGNWKAVDSTFASDYHWRRRVFAVRDYLTTLNDVQVKFIVSDNLVSTLRNDGQSVVEAGIDDFFIYDRAPVGIKDPQQIKAIIAPNPADECIQLTVTEKLKGNATLYDIAGRTLYTITLDGNSKQYMIPTKELAAGQYMLMIQSGSSVQNRKIIVQHH